MRLMLLVLTIWVTCKAEDISIYPLARFIDTPFEYERIKRVD